MEQQIKRAEKMAREIEGAASDNVHLREERGHAVEREVRLCDCAGVRVCGCAGVRCLRPAFLPSFLPPRPRRVTASHA